MCVSDRGQERRRRDLSLVRMPPLYASSPNNGTELLIVSVKHLDAIQQKSTARKKVETKDTRAEDYYSVVSWFRADDRWRKPDESEQ